MGIFGETGCSAEVCSLRVLFSSLLNHICWVLLFGYTDSVDPSKTGYWSEKFVTIFWRIAGGMLSTCVLSVWYDTFVLPVTWKAAVAGFYSSVQIPKTHRNKQIWGEKERKTKYNCYFIQAMFSSNLGPRQPRESRSQDFCCVCISNRSAAFPIKLFGNEHFKHLTYCEMATSDFCFSSNDIHNEKSEIHEWKHFSANTILDRALPVKDSSASLQAWTVTIVHVGSVAVIQ